MRLHLCTTGWPGVLNQQKKLNPEFSYPREKCSLILNNDNCWSNTIEASDAKLTPNRVTFSASKIDLMTLPTLFFVDEIGQFWATRGLSVNVLLKQLFLTRSRKKWRFNLILHWWMTCTSRHFLFNKTKLALCLAGWINTFILPPWTMLNQMSPTVNHLM